MHKTHPAVVVVPDFVHGVVEATKSCQSSVLDPRRPSIFHIQLESEAGGEDSRQHGVVLLEQRAISNVRLGARSVRLLVASRW
jgi:mRNA-degrading endonuclease toxin of MazEF toxin-antitoxin module